MRALDQRKISSHPEWSQARSLEDRHDARQALERKLQDHVSHLTISPKLDDDTHVSTRTWADQPVADLQCASAQDRRSPSKAVGPAQLETPVYRAHPKLDRQCPSSRMSPPADESRRFARFRRVRTDYRASDPIPQTPRLTLPTVIPPRYEDTHLSDLRSTGTHSHPRPPSPLPAAAPSKYRLTTRIPIRAQKSRPRNPRRPPNGYHPPRSQAVAGPHEPSKRSLFRAPGSRAARD